MLFHFSITTPMKSENDETSAPSTSSATPSSSVDVKPSKAALDKQMEAKPLKAALDTKMDVKPVIKREPRQNGKSNCNLKRELMLLSIVCYGADQHL
jgi:hypothetical protein